MHFYSGANAVEEARQRSAFVCLVLEVIAHLLQSIHKLIPLSSQRKAEEDGVFLCFQAQRQP